MYIDVQSAFDKLLETFTTYEIARGRIHPNNTGHTLISKRYCNILNNECPYHES
jgi:hypothetical protein